MLNIAFSQKLGTLVTSTSHSHNINTQGSISFNIKASVRPNMITSSLCFSLSQQERIIIQEEYLHIFCNTLVIVINDCSVECAGNGRSRAHDNVLLMSVHVCMYVMTL